MADERRRTSADLVPQLRERAHHRKRGGDASRLHAGAERDMQALDFQDSRRADSGMLVRPRRQPHCQPVNL
eukprot:3895671-Pleurochrysis_carterae.AAC.3